MGFLGAKTDDNLYKMVSACFTKVDDAKQFSLADIKAGGYNKSEPGKSVWTGGCKAGAFELLVLKNDGNPDAAYYWVDATTGSVKSPKVWEPGWYKDVEGDYIKMEDAEVAAIKFNLGQAFWISGGGMTLVSAGAVSPQRMEFKTNEDLYTSVGNGMPVDYTLGDLYVNGYAASEPGKSVWTGGCKAGAFELMILKNDGNPDAAYYWVDATTGSVKSPKVWEPGWYKDVEGDYIKMTKEEVAAVKVPAGQGFWVSGGTMNLVVPSPLAEEKPAEEAK